MATFDAIVPAGGRLSDAFSKVVGTRSKGLIRFDGRSILDRTIAALRDSGSVRRIVLVGPTEVAESAEAEKADTTVREGASGPENISRGLNFLLSNGPAPERVLVCTCDLPFITSDSVKKFLALCPDDKDICVPLISEEHFGDAFPQAPATFLKLQDGTYTTGCLYNMRLEALKRAMTHIERLFQRRKSKIGMARLLGGRFVWLMLTKRLMVSDIEHKVRELIGCTGAAIAGSPPELAFDVDYIEDYHYAVQSFRTMRRVPALH